VDIILIVLVGFIIGTIFLAIVGKEMPIGGIFLMNLVTVIALVDSVENLK